MFKLIATIIVMLNGTPSGEPARTPHRFEFVNLQKCIEFKDSEKGQEDAAKLGVMVKSRLPIDTTFSITLSCEKDDTI